MAGRAKELRLGLVCYGGSSLCIYMHGVTKEIHRLLHASALHADGGAVTEPAERVYAELLGELAEEADGVGLRVIVDVIAGTSAGGINGIFLGKAIAGNRSQDALRDLWFVRGDMNELVVGPRKLAGIRLGWKQKLPLLLARALKRSPLRGDDMARWLYRALESMDTPQAKAAGGPSLLPDGHPLDLWVTITDFYGYQRLIPLSRPRFAADARHRHVVGFHYESGAAGNDFDDNPALTFAARTTSCFPAVFPPVRPAELGEAIGGASLEGLLARSFRNYELNGADPNDTYFVDGGVLDNRPFGWAIDTIIRERPAESEVDRKLLYLEPDPGGITPTRGGASPQTLQAALGAAMSIPRAEPILDDLLRVDEHNDRVGRIRDVIEANFDRVGAKVDALVPGDVLAGPPAEWPWASWNDEVHEIALAEAGAAYATYVRLKISNVLDGFAAGVCAICDYPQDSNHAALVRQAIHAWARRAALYAGISRGESGRSAAAFALSPEQVEFLRAFDLGYMTRRLRFLIAALNWWYRNVGEPGFPVREELDRGKQVLYERVSTLHALARLEVGEDRPAETREEAAAIRTQVASTFEQHLLGDFLEAHGADGIRFADEHAGEIDALFGRARPFLVTALDGFAAGVLTELAPIAADWDAARRRDLVVRYLGFPIWDVLIYPVQSLSSTAEGDAVEVVRISPHEADLLPVPAGGKVEGTRFHHFYAFFEREARENDYLWGRLDAAEQLVRILLDAAASTQPPERWCKRLFAAVIAEEEDSLTSIAGKLRTLRGQIAQLDENAPTNVTAPGRA